MCDALMLLLLPQGELQRHVEVRGIDQAGNKEELANHLLDNLIAQVCGGVCESLCVCMEVGTMCFRAGLHGSDVAACWGVVVKGRPPLQQPLAAALALM